MKNLRGNPHSFLLAFLCAAFLVQCGGSDDQEALCDPSFLTGGEYAFRVGTVSDRCAGGVLAGLIPPGPYVMPLPGVAELPATVTLDLPFVGEISARLSVLGDSIRVVPEPPEISGTFEYLGVTITYQASASGILCPLSPSEANLSLAVEVLSLEPPHFAVPCRVVVTLTGSL